MSADNLPARRDEAAPVKVDLSKPLADLDEAMRLADHLSRSELVPNSLRGRPANILHVFMAGQSMGLDLATSLRVIFSPGPGQIGLRGQFLLAKLREAGHDYEWEETENSCTFTVHRDYRSKPPGRTYSAKFGLEDALAAGLLQKKADGSVVALSSNGKPLPWQAYQPNMYFWRAAAKCTNRAAPEVGLGFEIQGAEGPRDPEPEVQLVPQGTAPQAPAPPAAGEAAPGGEAAQARARLEALNAEMGGTEQQPGPDPEPQPEDLPAPAAPERPRVPERSKVVRLEARLATQFTELGWDPGTEHRAEILKACSMFAQRPVTTVRDLTEDEMEILSTELNTIIDKQPAAAYEAILSERVEAFSETWFEADEESHEAYARTL